MAVQRDNPYPNFNFVVDIGLGDAIGFSEVDLPAGEIEVIEYREGNEVAPPGAEAPRADEVLERDAEAGRHGNLELFEWWQAIRDGQLLAPQGRDHAPRRAAAAGAALGAAGAWPAKLDYSMLNALANEVVIETLELAHEGFEIE